MRRLFSGSLIALLFSFVCMSGVGAQPLSQMVNEANSGGFVRIQYGYGYGYSNCEDLRRACQYKDRLGEWGQGNCRRYYQQCGRGPGYYAQLRRACLYKYEYGQEGRGNCERYREECRYERY